MRLFVCIGFESVWPVPTSAVVVADDKVHARLVLGEKLQAMGMSLDADDELEEIPLDVLDSLLPGVHWLASDRGRPVIARGREELSG